MNGGGQFARHRAVIVAAFDNIARLGQDGGHTVLQRLHRHRLEQEFVDADLHGLDHARALAMAGEHDDRHIRVREGRRRAHHAHKTGAVKPGHLPVEDDDIRRHAADQVETGRPVRRLMDMAHADAQEHRTHYLAHVMLVVHYHDFGGGKAFGELFRVGRHRWSHAAKRTLNTANTAPVSYTHLTLPT